MTSRGRGGATILRWLAAALCLIASLAFATREIAPAAPRDTLGARAMGDAMPGMAHCEQTTHPAPTRGHDSHAGHCPFCFTNAFALEAWVPPLPDALTVRAPRAPPALVHARISFVRHADARAPPHLPVG